MSFNEFIRWLTSTPICEGSFLDTGNPSNKPCPFPPMYYLGGFLIVLVIIGIVVAIKRRR